MKVDVKAHLNINSIDVSVYWNTPIFTEGKRRLFILEADETGYSGVEEINGEYYMINELPDGTQIWKFPLSEGEAETMIAESYRLDLVKALEAMMTATYILEVLKKLIEAPASEEEAEKPR